MTTSWTRATLGLTALTLLAGCGNGTSADDGVSGAEARVARDPGGAESIDACRLITTAEAAQVLGERSAQHTTYVVTTTPHDDGTCTYAWTTTGAHDEFTLHQFPASRYVAQPGLDPRPIAGTGDDAWEENGTFYARVGEQIVAIVDVQEGDGADEDLLKIAADRLGS